MLYCYLKRHGLVFVTITANDTRHNTEYKHYMDDCFINEVVYLVFFLIMKQS
jgi:hypothetical protein